MQVVDSYPQIKNKVTELCNLATKYGTDKVTHGYTKYYDLILNKDKNNDINFLELGIYKGSSILMWNEYFTKGTIYCIDNCQKETCSGTVICNTNTVEELNKNPKIKGYYCNQDDENRLNKIFDNIEFDYICDDASHYQKETLKSLAILFKKLKSGGTYIIEDLCNIIDLQTGSYWGQKEHLFEVNDNGEVQHFWPDNRWMEDYKKTGKLKDENLYNDTMIPVFDKYVKTNVFYSEYLTNEENDYLTNNIKSIKFVSAPITRPFNLKYNGTPGTLLKTGALAIIEKK